MGDAVPENPDQSCPQDVWRDEAHFQTTLPNGEEETPISPDDPIQQKLFDRLPIPKSEKANFFKWLIEEEYVRQTQEHASKRDAVQARDGDGNERREGPETWV